MPFADELIGTATVVGLAKRLKATDPTRSWSAVRTSAKRLDGLGLSERARTIRDALLSDGPTDYWEFDALIRGALTDPGFTGWMTWPVTEAVATLATREHPAAARDHPEFEAGLGLLA